MTTFKDLLNEANTENSLFKKTKGTGKEYEVKNSKISAFGDFKDRKNDIYISASLHAKSQAHDRRPEFTKSDWDKLHKKTAEKINDDGMYDDGWKLFYSKSMQQGYIVLMKFVTSSNNLNVKVITVLPKGKNNPQGGNSGGTTELELMESTSTDPEVIEMLENIDIIEVIEM